MKMNRQSRMTIVAAAAIFALACLSSAPGEETPLPETIDVVASGVGMDETEATKDALANAVRQAIGAIVGTETLVQNEEIVRDQILIYSDGFAENYELVGKPGATLSGLASVTVRARIVRNKLIEKAKAANIAIVEVDGKGMFAEAVTKIARDRSALALIKDEFKDMPQRLIKAEIVEKLKYDQKTQKGTVGVKLSVDMAAYKLFVARLTKMLDEIGCPSFTISSIETEVETDQETGEQVPAEIRFLNSVVPEKYLRNLREWEDDYAVLAVCSTFNPAITVSRWRMYVLDAATMDAINAMLSDLAISVDILDGENQVLAFYDLPPLGQVDKYNGERHYEGPITFDFDNYCRHPYLLYVAPFVNGRIDVESSSDLVYFDIRGGWSITKRLQFDLSPEELASVANVVCKITPVKVIKGE